MRGPYGKDWGGVGDVRVSPVVSVVVGGEDSAAAANGVDSARNRRNAVPNVENAPDEDASDEDELACDQTVCLCDARFTMCLDAHAEAMRLDAVNPSFTHTVVKWMKRVFG